ncbi:hypothetical protein HYZ78_04100 [Candidatus Microgenomates bacterium]|nr:hypothetical protein [Candidatus Microgenomates bacterium]
MDVRFPFENVGKNFFGKVYRPVAKVSLKSLSNNIWSDTWMIVDTGADFTIVPQYFSRDLGISLESDCIKDITVGVGGEQIIYLCKARIRAQIGDAKREIPLAISDSNETPPLLGRLGFLETFDTEFLKKHIVVFKE